jgi:hypothetical protein
MGNSFGKTRSKRIEEEEPEEEISEVEKKVRKVRKRRRGKSCKKKYNSVLNDNYIEGPYT